MQSEVGSTELRFVLRRFPLIRTLHIHLFGPTVLPGAPREERAADDRHHKRTGWGGGGGVEAGGWGGGTGIKGGGAQVGGSGTESGGGETWNVSPHAAASTPPSSSAAASAAAAAAAVASPISGQQILDLTAIVRILSLNTPLQIQQMAGTQVESEVQQGLLNYMRHVVATWGRNIRHIEMHDPLPSSDEFWRCVDGGGFAELAEKCPGLEEIVLEDLTLSVVAKKARSAPGGGSAAGEGVGEEPGEVERAHGAMGANEADGWGGAVRESGEAEAAEVQAGAEGGKGAAAEGRGGNLAASFPNLSSLKVVNCALDAHWLEMFAGQLPGLRRLTIMACPDPLDQLFFTAVRTAARLESVEIVDCEGWIDPRWIDSRWIYFGVEWGGESTAGGVGWALRFLPAARCYHLPPPLHTRRGVLQGDLRGRANPAGEVVPQPAAHLLLWLPCQPPLRPPSSDHRIALPAALYSLPPRL
ncbi:unnamed protein product [Closterium sp. NIES-53]